MNLVSKRLLGGAAVVALVGGACTSTAATPTVAPSEKPSAVATPTPAAPVTVEWWHIGTTEPSKSVNQGWADAFTKLYPNVTIKITILENEAFKTKLATTIQSGTVPDIFQSWGGGTMAAQAEAGMLKDITALVAPWKDTINPAALGVYAVNGKQHGIPTDMGMIGFWYNKKMFAQAGITALPATWDEYLTAIQKLKTAGLVPLAIAGGHKWPSMHLWTYLVLRTGGGDAMAQMVKSGNWNTDACINGGKEVLKLNALNPYQPGYKTATYDNEAAAVGNGKAAMELMGQWAPAVQAANSTSKKGLGDDLGWFAFPAITGGAGGPADGVGGGNGYAVGKDAPDEAVEFLKFISSVENGKLTNSKGIGLSPVVGTADAITDVNLKMVAEGLSKATFMQLYLDQVTTPKVGTAINDATVTLFLGASTPEKVCQAITKAATAS